MIRFALRKALKAADGEMQLDVQYRIKPGTFLAIYGKSGVGKTSILRMLAGLMQADRGIIEVDGEIWLNTVNKVRLSPQKRAIGYVFQDYALFPNMTVHQNLEYALEKGQDPSILEELIAITELEQLQGRKPGTLSGGQKQRVALARALVRKPKLLLLDEPLSALEKEMRGKLQDYILKAHRKFGLSTILVSHDLSEVYKMADEVMVLERGLVKAVGSPSEVLGKERSSEGLQLIGEVLSIEQQGEFSKISILVGRSILPLKIDAALASTLNVGEEVLTFWDTGTARVQKIIRP